MMNDPKPFDISAEFLLNYLFPDHTDQWQAEYAGAFYRNYSPDILSFEEDRQTVRLSRDGFLRLLPQGIIAPDNILKGKGFEQKYEQLKKKEELLKDLFKPVDTLNFRFRLHIEKETSQLSSEKLALLLKYYFDYELEKEKNPYIRKTAPLLLLVSHLRADFSFLHTLLKCLFGCPVEMTTGRYMGRRKRIFATCHHLPADCPRSYNRGVQPAKTDRRSVCRFYPRMVHSFRHALRHCHQTS